VAHGGAERADRRERVDPLPEEVRRVEVDGEGLPDCLVDAPERRHVVDRVLRVELEADARDAVVEREATELAPGRDRLLPLPFEQRDLVVGPRVPVPVDRRRARAVAGRARHRDDLRHPEQLCQPDRPPDDLALRPADDRVERPGRAVEGRDPEPAPGERVTERGPGALAFEQLVEPNVRRGRLPTAGDLDRRRADPDGEIERLVERESGRRVGEQAELHVSSLGTVQAALACRFAAVIRSTTSSRPRPVGSGET